MRPPDVITAFWRHAEQSPDAVFCRLIAHGNRTSVTYGEALDRAARYANLLRGSGVAPGATVIIILKHSTELYFAFLGAMLAGCTPSFMPFSSVKQDPQLYWSRHRELFEAIGADAVITFADNRAPLAEHCLGMRVFTPVDAAGQDASWPAPRVDPQAIALLQHSSGTTGQKKGVRLSHGAVAAQIERYREALDLGSDAVIVSWLPLYHDMGLIACFMLPVTLGLPIVSLDAFEWVARPTMLFDEIERYGGTHVWLPNFAFHHLCRTADPVSRPDLSSVRAFIDCSEPCRYETFELFARTFEGQGVRWDQLRVCYAMAETVFAVTQTPTGETVAAMDLDEVRLEQGIVAAAIPGHRARRVVSVGRPLRDVALRVVGAAGEALGERRVGEVAVKAPFLFSGYNRDPQRTAAKLRGGWYFTGDVGFLAEGQLYLLGRTDDLIIVNGRNILAHDVEFTVNAEASDIKAGRCVALGSWSEETGSHDLVLVAEIEDADPARRVAISRNIKTAVLASFGVMLKEVRLVSPGWLVKTTSGKLSRRDNLLKYLGERDARSRPQTSDASS